MLETILCIRHQYLSAVCLDAGGSSSFPGGDYNNSQGSSAPCISEIFYQDFMWNSGGDENPFDSTGGKEDEDDNGASKTEDLEIRMDLTDDLLHMVNAISFLQVLLHFPFFPDSYVLSFCSSFLPQVFSFLDYVDLCRAAMVCRQWRAASAHEDFWRCLNFENRKISLEQCEFSSCTRSNMFLLSFLLS